MSRERSLRLLLEYRDKSYVMTAMYQRSFEFFSLLNSICKISTILGKFSQAISLIESAIYLVALVVLPFSAGTANDIWSLTCKIAEKTTGFYQEFKKCLEITIQLRFLRSQPFI